jgi:hypothetical protein
VPLRSIDTPSLQFPKNATHDIFTTYPLLVTRTQLLEELTITLSSLSSKITCPKESRPPNVLVLPPFTFLPFPVCPSCPRPVPVTTDLRLWCVPLASYAEPCVEEEVAMGAGWRVSSGSADRGIIYHRYSACVLTNNDHVSGWLLMGT